MTSMTPQSQVPSPPSIAFIGGGNMARSLIAGLVAHGMAAASIRVAEPVEALRSALHDDYGVATFAGAAEAVDGAGTWVFAVKPQVMRAVCAELAGTAQSSRPLVVSIAAGITSDQLDRWLDGGLAVVRTMPNTPALLGAGITGLFANAHVDAQQRAQAGHILSSAGETVWIDDETLMDAVTAESGSGPAYVFLLAEAMQAAGEAQGLPADTARKLAAQTILGAARMLVESGETAEVLRKRVTSPGGTTQAAIETFEAGGFRELVGCAITAATVRGRELSKAND
ncbi:pyrroline-5-carboxylate reductase [Marilutibacter alkalisoli]|uniref:Pyrroline-5-carboxylate reductase n=1 Tax=Marilutibacter alkalisoli TaxID=2591633 RepID=A0A514BPL4_9GAMM|nr:pyrroline-5-carboxylate reductase [Lysobacter alkalisoli]QDH69321.1 pyrroline-5-carboxylate reductase [Lysobacter alkalisoli]